MWRLRADFKRKCYRRNKVVFFFFFSAKIGYLFSYFLNKFRSKLIPVKLCRPSICEVIASMSTKNWLKIDVLIDSSKRTSRNGINFEVNRHWMEMRSTIWNFIRFHFVVDWGSPKKKHYYEIDLILAPISRQWTVDFRSTIRKFLCRSNIDPYSMSKKNS